MKKLMLMAVCGAVALTGLGAEPEERLAPLDAAHAPETRRMACAVSLAVSPRNGRLWLSYFVGSTDGEDSNNYVVLATRRGDEPWREVLFVDPDGDGPWRAFDPELWVAPDGRLRWTWTERAVPRRDVACSCGMRENGRFPYVAERLRGATLDAEEIPSAPYPEVRTLNGGGVMLHKPIVTRAGTWLYPLAYWYDDFSARLYASTDGGATLRPVGGATVPPAHREFDEHNVVELRDGTLRVYLRACGNAGWNAWQAESRDGGRSWDAAKPCPFPHTNSRFWVCRLKSGALLLVKNGPIDAVTATADYQGRVDMRAYVSDDDGATWHGGLLVHAGPCRYPDGDQAPDGTIHLVLAAGSEVMWEPRVYAFTEDEVRNGKFKDK